MRAVGLRRTKAGGGQAAREKAERRQKKLIELAPSIRAVALGFYTNPTLRRTYTADDLIQEVYLKALRELEKGFRVDYSFKAYVLMLAKNHLRCLLRSAGRASAPQAEDLTSYQFEEALAVEKDLDHPMHRRLTTKRLLRWLRENPWEIRHGWLVLNLMLWNHGNTDLVALAMNELTASAWTCEGVRIVIRKIKQTELGEALCGALDKTPTGGPSGSQ